MLAKPPVLLLLPLWIGVGSACGTEPTTELDVGQSAEDTGDSGVTGDTGSGADDTLSCFDESLPKVLWFGPDNVGPCEGPCYTVVEGSYLSDEDQCWRSGQPLMCWGGGVYGDMPTQYRVEGLGTVSLGADYFVDDELAAYGATRVNQWPEAPECDGDDGSGEGSGMDDVPSCTDESLPGILWFGPDNIEEPCERPCYEVVEARVWDEASQCWGPRAPLMCWRSRPVGAMPVQYEVEGVGLVELSNLYLLTEEERLAFDVTEPATRQDGEWCPE